MIRIPSGNGRLLLSIHPPIGGDGQLDTSRHLATVPAVYEEFRRTAFTGGKT